MEILLFIMQFPMIERILKLFVCCSVMVLIQILSTRLNKKRERCAIKTKKNATG